MKMIVFTKNEDRIVQSGCREFSSSLRKRSHEGPTVLLVYLSGGQVVAGISSSYQKSLLKENTRICNVTSTNTNQMSVTIKKLGAGVAMSSSL